MRLVLSRLPQANVIASDESFGEGCERRWHSASFVAPEDGELTFELDNSGSWFASRLVECMFSMPPEATGNRSSMSCRSVCAFQCVHRGVVSIERPLDP